MQVMFDSVICGRSGAVYLGQLPVAGDLDFDVWGFVWAYHAANSLLKHPDVFKRCFAMSGVYD